MSTTAAPPKLSGWLDRGGKTWPMPLAEDLWFFTPVDDLFVGDQLSFPALHGRQNLLLRVVFSCGRVFRDNRYAERFTRSVIANYELMAAVGCPACGHSAAHPVLVAETDTHPRGGRQWPFERSCLSCGHQWSQTGCRPESIPEEASWLST